MSQATSTTVAAKVESLGEAHLGVRKGVRNRFPGNEQRGRLPGGRHFPWFLAMGNSAPRGQALFLVSGDGESGVGSCFRLPNEWAIHVV